VNAHVRHDSHDTQQVKKVKYKYPVLSSPCVIPGTNTYKRLANMAILVDERTKPSFKELSWVIVD
jgi:hypothetical protein